MLFTNVALETDLPPGERTIERQKTRWKDFTTLCSLMFRFELQEFFN